MEYYKLEDVAKTIGRTPSYVRRCIRDPRKKDFTAVLLPVSEGSTRESYYFTPDVYQRLIGLYASGKPKRTDYKHVYDEWIEAMSTGYKQTKNKPLTAKTIKTNKEGIERFWARTGLSKDITQLTPDNLQKFYATLPLDEINRKCFYSQKSNTYDAVRSFVRFLNNAGYHTGYTMEQFSAVKPHRHYDPKRETISQNDLELLVQKTFDWVGTGRSKFNRQFSNTVALLFVDSWVRLDEAVILTIDDIDLTSRRMRINGKGGKSRVLGITARLAVQLELWINDYRPKKESRRLFVGKNGEPVTADHLTKKIVRLARNAGLTVYPHALRRSGATAALRNERRPMNVKTIQKLLGHSSLVVTQLYLNVEELEAADEMRDMGSDLRLPKYIPNKNENAPRQKRQQGSRRAAVATAYLSK